MSVMRWTHEETLTILEFLPSLFCEPVISCGINKWVNRKWPKWLMAICDSKPSLVSLYGVAITPAKKRNLEIFPKETYKISHRYLWAHEPQETVFELSLQNLWQTPCRQYHIAHKIPFLLWATLRWTFQQTFEPLRDFWHLKIFI